MYWSVNASNCDFQNHPQPLIVRDLVFATYETRYTNADSCVSTIPPCTLQYSELNNTSRQHEPKLPWKSNHLLCRVLLISVREVRTLRLLRVWDTQISLVKELMTCGYARLQQIRSAFERSRGGVDELVPSPTHIKIKNAQKSAKSLSHRVWENQCRELDNRE